MRFILQIFLLLIEVHSVQPQDVKAIYTSGDIILGGVFPVHGAGTQEEPCFSMNRERGIQRLEAMRFAIQQVNANPNLLKGVHLGASILDTCSDPTYALDQSIEFVMSTLAASQSDHCSKATNDSQPKQNIAAVVGGAYSSVSIQMANLLRLFKIPQISYASTSAELSKKQKYDYFLRTVPPDTLQAKALVDIANYLNWTYVSTVASDDNYGVSGIDSFKQEYSLATGQCIATELKISKNADRNDFNRVVENLYSRKARVVILFVGQDHARGILNAATAKGYHDDFIWVASDGWGNGIKPVEGNELTANGALTVMLKSKTISDFDTYFKQLKPSTNQENVWFEEYWEKTHNCTFPNHVHSRRAVGSGLYAKEFNEKDAEKKVCTGDEVDNDYKQESKVQFVFDAVYAVALGLDRLYKEICGKNATKLCPEMNLNNSMRKTLTKYITENKEDGMYVCATPKV